MKTKLLILAGLTLPLIAGETAKEREARIDFQQRIEIENQRFRDQQRHREIVDQQERIHRESTIQRERNMERIERVIPRRPYYDTTPTYPYGQRRTTGPTR